MVLKCKALPHAVVFTLKCLSHVFQNVKALLCAIFASGSVEILLPCGNKLVVPVLHEGQQLDGNMIQKVFKRASLYLRPSEPLQVSIRQTELI